MQINQPVYNITSISKHFLLSKRSSLRDYSGKMVTPQKLCPHAWESVNMTLFGEKKPLQM